MRHPPDQPDAASSPAPAGPDGAPLRFRDRVRLRHGASELVVFRVGEEWFAVEIQAVEEVLDAPSLRSVPDAPAALLGLFQHHDEVLPLYTPSRLLGVAAQTGAIVLLMRGARRHVALAVDDVDDVVHVDLRELRDPPHRDHGDEIVAGICWSQNRLVAVLDARALVGACIGALGTRAA